MRRELLFALSVVLAAAIVAMATASFAWVVWDAFRETDQESFRALVGAFAGALFAFLFVRLGEGMMRVYERKEKHHNAVVRLMHYFNECLNITGDNIYVVDTALDVFSEERFTSPELPILFNQFLQYPIDRELVLGLTNLDFANEVFSLNIDLRKLNDSMATIDRSYGEIKEALISKNIDRNIYVGNVRHSRPRYFEVKEFLLGLKETIIKLMATANLLSRDAPFMVRAIRGLSRSKYSKDFGSLREKEIKKVTSEIEANADSSRAKIEQIKQRVAQQRTPGDGPRPAGSARP
jgi:hypothetical protein